MSKISKKSEYTWWEKSVEYQFVIDAINSKSLSLLIPLDGYEEKIGDGIFANDTSFLIIEFKKTLADFDSEYQKYGSEDNFQLAKTELLKINSAKHHLLVTGHLIGENSDELKLSTCIYEYFNHPVTKGSVAKALDHGVIKSELDKYIETLIQYKTQLTEGGGSESIKSEILAQTKIVGVSSSPVKIQAIISLQRYQEIYMAKRKVTKPKM